MKNKHFAYIVITIQIVILILLLNANSLTTASGIKVHLAVSSSDILGLLEGNSLKLPLNLRNISTAEVQTDGANFKEKERVQVVISPDGKYWRPIYVGKRKLVADANTAVLQGKVKSVTKSPGYIIEYKVNGRLLSATFVGKLRGKLKSGDKVMLRVDANDPSRIEHTLPYMTYANRVIGEIVQARQILTKEFTYELTIHFKVDGQMQRAGYISKFYDPINIPSRGTKVIVSYVRDGDSYKIIFLDYNPLIVGTIASQIDVYELKVSYGIEKHHLTNKLKDELQRIGEELKTAEVSIDVIVGKWGRTRISTLYVGERSIEL